MKRRSPSLIPYSTEHALRQKSGFASSFSTPLGVWVIQIHSDERQLTPLRLRLVFRRGELQLVCLDQLHIQSYMHLHIHTELYRELEEVKTT